MAEVGGGVYTFRTLEERCSTIHSS